MTQPEIERVRAYVERLNARGGGDWQSVMRDVDRYVRPVRLNLAQGFAALIGEAMPSVKTLDLEWSRATGKTTGYAFFTRQIMESMPRAHFQWVVPTYVKFLTEIVPPYIHALEMNGLYKDLHYFIGRKPPATWKWPEAYQPPIKYDHSIVFYNGFTFSLLSQDISGSGRGPSYDGKFGDEAAMLDPVKMDSESDPAIRGSNNPLLGDKRYFDFRMMASSTPLTEAGEWFIQREEMARLSPNKHQFLRANCMCNLHNLKPDYIEEARRTARERWIFEAEYLNIRPNLTRGGFYALADQERHTYTAYNYGHYEGLIGAKPDCRGDGDLLPSQPLILGVDWGNAINSLVVCQHVGAEFRVLKNFFVLDKNGEYQDELFGYFTEYYHFFQKKEIWMYYDATGNYGVGNTKLTRANQAAQSLRAKGWNVRMMTNRGTNPRHFEKYQLWEAVFKEDQMRLPKFRLNRANCHELWVSLKKAKSKVMPNGDIKKDKSGERVDNPQRQYATDLSDALDQALFGMFNQTFRMTSTAMIPVGSS